MTRELLDNERWGFESNCFACEPKNEAGLGIGFYGDADEGVVTAEFSLDDRFSGAPSYLHGGVVLTVLDEAMAWATIALAGSFAVTKETTTRFRTPVRVGGRYTVTARIDAEGEREIECSAVVTEGDTRCAEASATFVRMGPAMALDALGADAAGDDASFVRDED